MPSVDKYSTDIRTRMPGLRTHAGGPMTNSRRFPSPLSCKTESIADVLYECLSEDASLCPYVTRFGYGYYCKHPDCPNFGEVS